MRGPLSRWGEAYNYVEIGLWAVIGLVVLVRARRRSGAARRDGLIAGVALVAFGISDWAEIRTGGEWWKPWWLLAWKATCIVVLLALGLLAYRRAKRDAPDPPPV